MAYSLWPGWKSGCASPSVWRRLSGLPTLKTINPEVINMSSTQERSETAIEAPKAQTLDMKFETV
ncbi:hypothetical protein, partial [Mesorhizobium sp. M2D.F.Ca.ET.223.01.1.1]|uniref:hypothetical protein n=1 Tax=Mesorhizobium sp. M2D.F.Ca.ET.223.01.1.1 TaxID=2563940 RepID=UPI001AED7D6E